MKFQLILLLYGCVCFVYTIAAEEPSANVHSPPLEAINVKDFPLRKCHCGANKFWQNGTCKRATTSVEFLTSFYESVRVSTSDIGDLFVSDVVCKDAAPVHINNVAINGTENVLFHRESGDNFQKFCVEHVKNNNGDIIVTAVVCIPAIKLPVCCSHGHSINFTSFECIKHKNVTINPTIHIGTGASILPSADISPYLQQLPQCEWSKIQKKLLYMDTSGRKGSLHYQNANVVFMEWDNSEIPKFPITMKFPEHFCVDAEIGTETSYSVYIWDEWSHELCRNSSKDYNSKGRDDRCEEMMYWTLLPLLILSSVCLVVILVLHAILPELRITIGSKITLAHVTSLLGGFFVLILLQMQLKLSCKIYGPLVQGCFLATFFWLNVMCFDLWWKLRCSPAGDDGRHGKNKFLKYSIYAWGSPLLIVIVTVVLDNIEGLENHPSLIVPGFGKTSCWFEDAYATMTYYFGIISVLMVVNVFLFIWILIILVRANYTYNRVLRDDVRSPRRTWIYMKIFGVMGISWIFEIISWQEDTCTYWIVTDVINSLRGLLLLIIFFGNKKSYNKITSRFSDMHVRFHSQLSQSMNNLRKLSLKPMSTSESTLEAMRTESLSEASNKAHGHQNETCRREVINVTT